MFDHTFFHGTSLLSMRSHEGTNANEETKGSFQHNFIFRKDENKDSKVKAP
jgi:hypothetical protein